MIKHNMYITSRAIFNIMIELMFAVYIHMHFILEVIGPTLPVLNKEMSSLLLHGLVCSFVQSGDYNVSIMVCCKVEIERIQGALNARQQRLHMGAAIINNLKKYL